MATLKGPILKLLNLIKANLMTESAFAGHTQENTLTVQEEKTLKFSLTGAC